MRMNCKRFLSHRKYYLTSPPLYSTKVLILLCILLLSSANNKSHVTAFSITTTTTNNNKAIVSRPARPSFSHPRCSSGSRRLIRSVSSSLSARKNKMTTTNANYDNNNKSYNNNIKNNYLRWNRTPDAWEMQTAVTVFERKIPGKNKIERVHLHAQLHYGNSAYYEYYNNAPSFTLSQHDAVLYELLLDENLLIEKNNNKFRYIKPNTLIQASSHDQNIAKQYGWTCQADTIRYAKSGAKWIHADLTRQEFLNQLHNNNNEKEKEKDRSTSTEEQQDQPLWQQAAAAKRPLSNNNPLLAMAGSLPLVSEAATALLVGPPLVVESSATTGGADSFYGGYGLPRASLGTAAAATEFRQSIFSQTISILRSVLWMTVPAPEISVLLLDWSALLFVNTAEKDNKKNFVQLGSPWVYEVLQQLVQGRIQAVRQLYFGQIVLTGQNKDDDGLLVTHRNQHAMKVLQQVLNQKQHDDTTAAAATSTDVALLYGCHHCNDLHQRLNRMGFVPVFKQWRTAFDIPRVDVSSKSDRTRNVESFLSSWTNSIEQNPTPTVGIMVLIISYLAIGGMDWIATWQDVISSASFQAVSSDAVLYLIRHVMLYVALSKLLLDPNWTGSSSSGSVDGE